VLHLLLTIKIRQAWQGSSGSASRERRAGRSNSTDSGRWPSSPSSPRPAGGCSIGDQILTTRKGGSHCRPFWCAPAMSHCVLAVAPANAKPLRGVRQGAFLRHTQRGPPAWRPGPVAAVRWPGVGKACAAPRRPPSCLLARDRLIPDTPDFSVPASRACP
jgi:hypothetical protein